MTDDRMIRLSDDRKVQNLVRNYYDLEVYKKSFEISLEIHKASLNFPNIEQYALANQIRKASKGICANIAEGFAKQQTSKPEFRRFLLIALGSAHEMRVWVDYCRELAYIAPETAARWAQEYESISRMLQNFINRL
jgi:four helix bundle protein